MFSERLRQARIASKMSQKELASRLFISQQAYAKYETNTASPNPEMLALIARELKVSVDYLLGHPWYSRQPVNMLCCLYGIGAFDLAKICNISERDAELWANGYHRLPEGEFVEMYPSGEIAETLSDFFEIPLDDLTKGLFPPDVKSSVMKKVAALKEGKRYKLQNINLELFGSPTSERPPTTAPDGSLTIDGFTYALQHDYPNLTDTDVKIVESLAKQLNDAKEQKGEQ